MHPLLGVLVATATCALARPPVLPRHGPMLDPYASVAEYQREGAREGLLSDDWRSDEDPTIGHILPPRPRPIDWLSEEIARLTLKEYDDYERERESQLPNQRVPYLAPAFNLEPRPENEDPEPRNKIISYNPHYVSKSEQSGFIEVPSSHYMETNYNTDNRKAFAYTPLDKEFFEEEYKIAAHPMLATIAPQVKLLKADIVFEEPRKTRQNPNLSRTKTLIAENLDKLRAGTMVEEDSSDVPRHLVHDPLAQDPADSIYGVALIAAVGAAISVVIVGFGFGWYTLSKKAKAAADVDYPAYGVTGPSSDVTGDRKLAHSAHMYHYQHQKQQILAMERNGLERSGSVSDPESEEENEEGDYTVYEWPGFATTGDMEVKNPLFSEEPTPATPCKIQVVKPQPKD